jgi:uncharacterized protein (TIGR02186 family)
MRALILALLLSVGPVMAEESLVTGLSRDDVQITADFTGSDILVYGAVRRNSPAPQSPPMDLIVTLEGPSSPVTVRRKERIFGIWVNRAAVDLAEVPSYFAIASSGALDQILSPDDDLKHQISLARRLAVTKITAESMDSWEFLRATQRIGSAKGNYVTQQSGVKLAEDTLFRADFALPANLTEGDFTVRMFLLRGGRVIDTKEQSIEVRKTGIERQLTNMAHHQPLLYGILSLLLAAVAGWGASEIFRIWRR